jgi:hypothetical protein
VSVRRSTCVSMAYIAYKAHWEQSGYSLQRNKVIGHATDVARFAQLCYEAQITRALGYAHAPSSPSALRRRGSGPRGTLTTSSAGCVYDKACVLLNLCHGLRGRQEAIHAHGIFFAESKHGPQTLSAASLECPLWPSRSGNMATAGCPLPGSRLLRLLC